MVCDTFCGSEEPGRGFLIVDEVWKAMLGALGLLLLREASISEAAITRRSGEKGRIMRVPDAYRPRLGYRGSRLSAF